MEILDIHSHRRPPYEVGVVSMDDLGMPLMDGQAYSAGIHPWNITEEIPSEQWQRLEMLAHDSRIAAIGECGVDISKGGPLFRQLQVFKRQIELSERVGKPLIIHCVKAADIILGLKRDLQPQQPWIIHGFRGKPQLARQLTDKGIFLSFGEKFNPDTVVAMPKGMLLAETDESVFSITEIISALSQAAKRDLMPEVISATARVLQLNQ